MNRLRAVFLLVLIPCLGMGVLTLAGYAQNSWIEGTSGSLNALIRFAEQEMKEVDPIARSRAAEALGVLARPEVAPYLAAALRDTDCRVRASAARSLGMMGGVLAESLMTSLTDWDPNVRGMAATALGDVGYCPAETGLVIRLSDGMPRVRQAAALALGKLRRTAAVPPLIALLKDWDARVRASAVHALGEIGDSRAGKPLLPLVEDGDAKVRAECLLALAKLRRPGVSKILERRLGDWDAGVRHAAAQAFGILGDPSGVGSLTLALSDANARVRAAAVDAWAQIGDPSGIQNILRLENDWDPGVRESVAQALSSFESAQEAQKALLRLCVDSYASVRTSAIRSIEVSGCVTGKENLCNALNDWDGDVRAAAACALGTCRYSKAAGDLITRLQWDPNFRVRKNAARSLGELGTPDAIAALRKAIADWNQEVGMEAAAALRSLSSETKHD
ncbi:MAG: HEAT repeat domain-containing protein [Candidatus Eisenbacteria sp.]|nr:HEAT repeat domain-containing protein [Candidatus Eisenbacteria bacterium]